MSLSFDIVVPSEGKVFRTHNGKILGTELEIVPVDCYTVRKLTIQDITCTSWDGVNGSVLGPCIDCKHNPYGQSNTRCVDSVTLAGVWVNDATANIAIELTGTNLILGESIKSLFGIMNPRHTVTLTLKRDDDNSISLDVNHSASNQEVIGRAKQLIEQINLIRRS